MTAQSPILPEEIAAELNDISENSPHIENAPKIFLGIPNMGMINVALILGMFAWARDPKYKLWFHLAIEKRHTDFARNILVAEFLKTDCEFMAMVDADTSPNPEFLSLTKHDKDIIAGNTHCWINNELIPSIWQRSACEQCFCLKKWLEEDVIHDPREYMVDKGIFFRWNPQRQDWSRFANKSGILGGMKCRCGGTGEDPWVFKMWQKAFEPGKIIQCDSVGSASMILKRHVVENLPAPHFMFYYRPSREILLTEDHYFCWMASNRGYEIWADLDMVSSHYKTIDLAGVNARMVKAFHAGMEYQKSSDEKYNIILPTDQEVKSLTKL